MAICTQRGVTYVVYKEQKEAGPLYTAEKSFSANGLNYLYTAASLDFCAYS